MMFLFTNFYYQTYMSRKLHQSQKLHQKKSGDNVYRDGYLADKTMEGAHGKVAPGGLSGQEFRRRDRQVNGNNNAKWNTATSD